MNPSSIVTNALAAQFKDEKYFGQGGERTHVWASRWRPCARWMALDLMHPEDRDEIDEDGCARMAWGDAFETEIRARLERAGRLSDPPFTVEAAQEHFNLRDRSGRVILTGKIDGKLRISDPFESLPFEIKRGETVKRCRTIEDMLSSFWSRVYVYQMLAYLFGMGSPVGIMILDTGAVPRILEIRLEEHLDKAEDFMQAAERAVDCKLEGKPLPDFSENPEDCQRCEHRGKSCAPPWFSGEGPFVSKSPELIELVSIVGDEDKAEAAKRYGKARRRILDMTRGKDLVIIGDRTITGRKAGNGWRMTIEKG